MSGTVFLLELIGYIVMLLWGAHMVTSGVLRGYGSMLRRWLGRYLGHRASAFVFGMGLTTILQSSTATGLMASSFSASGLLSLTPALAVMLGANVGSTLVVQLMSLDMEPVAPMLVIVGYMFYRRGDDARWDNLGQAIIGLGLMLLALHLMVSTLATVEHAQLLKDLLHSLDNEPLLAVAIAAGLTLACHSSVAVVLLVTSLASVGVVSGSCVLALVLGANLGGTLPALLEASTPQAKRLPLGNMLIRLVGCLICLPFLHPLSDALTRLGFNASRSAVDFHTAFNILLALIFIWPLDHISHWLSRLLPEPSTEADPGQSLYLDEGALENAGVALANASREALRMADMAESMLKGLVELFGKDDRARAAKISSMDASMDKLSLTIRSYLTDLGNESLNEEDAERSQDILVFVLNFEHIGDITANNLMEFAAKKAASGQDFDADDILDLALLHSQVMESLSMAVQVFMRSDLKAAKLLVERKEALRRIEAEAVERHLHTLKERHGDGGDVYLRILRDLRRIHSHLVATAYPLLERADFVRPRGLSGAGRS